ncbi:hypothetical protein BDZ94DRAFT_1304142 [Collybia nuda]|uniref:K Homology domain-containing protein n=1 Tax=Collybia nuda TaxID=64659 RepID=A0A9P5YHY1_9AGAR|nr:hypothetical protein BDZ94DRAFT_1304142 [Collybia nuda]
MCSLVLVDDLAPHVIGRQGRGLKQIHDISGARLTAYAQLKDGVDERHVNIRGSDSQIGDALVIIGKRLARKRVRTPKGKKKDSSGSTSAPAPPAVRSAAPVGPLAPPAPIPPTPRERSSGSKPPPAATSTSYSGVRFSVPISRADPPPHLPDPTPTPPSVIMRSPSAAPTPSLPPGSPMDLSRMTTSSSGDALPRQTARRGRPWGPSSSKS